MSGVAYRFTPEDEERIRAAIIEAMATWRTTRSRPPGDVSVLMRIAAHSIGCGVADLRDIERDWIANEIRFRNSAASI